MTLILLVLLVLLLAGGLGGPANLRNVAWVLLVLVGVWFLVSLR